MNVGSSSNGRKGFSSEEILCQEKGDMKSSDSANVLLPRKGMSRSTRYPFSFLFFFFFDNIFLTFNDVNHSRDNNDDQSEKFEESEDSLNIHGPAYRATVDKSQKTCQERHFRLEICKYPWKHIRSRGAKNGI